MTTVARKYFYFLNLFKENHQVMKMQFKRNGDGVVLWKQWWCNKDMAMIKMMQYIGLKTHTENHTQPQIALKDWWTFYEHDTNSGSKRVQTCSIVKIYL